MTDIRFSQPAGYNEVIWDGKDYHNQVVPFGFYLYKMPKGEFLALKKLLLIKITRRSYHAC